MKNFSKTLISMAAVMAVGSAMAVSAMAETLNFDQTKLTKDGTITISGVTTGKSQYTLLVVKGTLNEETKVYSYDANSSTIKQVDQNDLGKPFDTIVLGTLQKDGTYKLDEGSYKVLVGNNDGSLDSGTFVVSNTPEPVKFVVGDATGEGKLSATDASAVAKYKVGIISVSDKNITVGDKYKVTEANGNFAVGATVVVGDATGEGKLSATDASAIAKYKVGIISTSDKNVDVGTELKAVKISE